MDAGLPPGALLSGRGPGAARLARCLQRWSGSPAAELGAAIAARVGDCPTFAAAGDDPFAWAAGAACGAEDPLAAVRGDADLAFALPVADDARAIGTLRVSEDGRLAGTLAVDLSPEPGLASLFVPAAAPPGEPVLSNALAVAHARVRVEGGIDPGALLPDQGAGAEMFRLGGSVLAGTALDGTWELALYAPPPGDPVPRPVAAVGVRSRGVAVAGMERFLADVEAQWDVRRVPYTHEGRAGACLPGLQLLPTLAPCYVATERALVLAWDAASLEHALRGGARPAAAEVAIDLDALPGADRVVRAAMGWPPDVPPYPWGRIELRAARDASRLVLGWASARGCDA